MHEFNLLGSCPRSRRDIAARHAAQADSRAIARQFGREYFDGTREQGYGGYRYDGRWAPVARDIVAHWGLRAGDRVLDIGCAKGFLVKDMMQACPGLEAFGLDISEYAVMHCEPEVVGRLHLASIERLPFPDRSFRAVLAINVVHNLDRAGCARALKEMMRVSSERCFVQVDSYRTPEEKENMERWVLTAVTTCDPDGWRALFREVGYTGEYYWTITE